MARIRSIKPEFWTDEKLVELDYADRLFFIGLWNFADDQGYIDYRPKRLKMQIFPGDDYDVIEGLRRLHEASLISLYASNRGLIVHIDGWDKHQKVSNPARERFSRADLRICEDFDATVQRPLETYPAEGKGREGKGRETSEIAEAIPDPPRPEIERLCTRLADRIEANGSNRPSVGKGWRDAARLMLDKDGRTEEQVAACIDWCQADEFWRGNILSMPKLREKYDQLRLQAQSRRPQGQVVAFARPGPNIRTQPDDWRHTTLPEYEFPPPPKDDDA